MENKENSTGSARSPITTVPKDSSMQEEENALEFERKLEQARALLIQNPLCRLALYRILTLCATARLVLQDLEKAIEAMPEYATVTQPPYALIEWLVEVQALDYLELDAEGNEVTDERRQGLSEDEIDDLVTDLAFQTSVVGEVLLEDMAPRNRMEELLMQVPERASTYREVLEFLQERHSFVEIDSLLRGREILMLGREANDRPMQPSVFVDKLAAAGSIAYSNGWMITQEGKEFLESRW